MNWLCLTAGVKLRCLDAEHIAIRSLSPPFFFFPNSSLTIKYSVRVARSWIGNAQPLNDFLCCSGVPDQGKPVRSDKRLRCFEEWWQPKNTKKPEVKEFALKGAECSLS